METYFLKSLNGGHLGDREHIPWLGNGAPKGGGGGARGAWAPPPKRAPEKKGQKEERKKGEREGGEKLQMFLLSAKIILL